MSVKIKEIINYMEKYAPSSFAEDWDNVGLMVGNPENSVQNVIAALDVSDAVIDEAINKNASLIITHHPLIFKSLKNITSSTSLGARIMKLIKNDIAVFSAHTNLDIARGGTNDTFAKLLNLSNIENLCEPVLDNEGLGKIGCLNEPVKFIDLIDLVKKILGITHLVVSGDKNKVIKKVGIGTGKCSGFDYMMLAKEKGCDAYITGDIGYHDAQVANDLNLCIIDATHYASEVLVVPVLCSYLNNCAEKDGLDFNCFVSEVDGQTLNII